MLANFRQARISCPMARFLGRTVRRHGRAQRAVARNASTRTQSAAVVNDSFDELAAPEKTRADTNARDLAQSAVPASWRMPRADVSERKIVNDRLTYLLPHLLNHYSHQTNREIQCRRFPRRRFRGRELIRLTS